jgi:hypothetical protein
MTGWKPLFDGKSSTAGRPAKIRTFTVKTARSSPGPEHLFYVSPVNNADQNQLKADVKTDRPTPASISHGYRETDWRAKVSRSVNNTHRREDNATQ